MTGGLHIKCIQLLFNLKHYFDRSEWDAIFIAAFQEVNTKVESFIYYAMKYLNCKLH